MLNTIDNKLTIDIIKNLHKCLMSCNFEFISKGERAGEFKHRANIVGTTKTTKPEDVENSLNLLISKYPRNPKLIDICDFHFDFECIHLFQDGNGRVGRLIMFRECLKHLNKICIIPEIFNLEYKKSFIEGNMIINEEFNFKEN